MGVAGLQLPVLLYLHLGGSSTAVATVLFGFGYALVALLGLGVAWWCARPAGDALAVMIFWTYAVAVVPAQVWLQAEAAASSSLVLPVCAVAIGCARS